MHTAPLSEPACRWGPPEPLKGIKMKNARNFSMAAMAAALVMGAGVAQANPFEGDQAIAPKTVASTLSRAQVQAELVAAQRDGSMPLVGDRINTYSGERQTSALSRAEVQAQAHQALIAGKLPQGNGSFGE